MGFRGPLDYLSLWELYLAAVALVLLSGEAGLRLGVHRRHCLKGAQQSPVSEIVAAMVGLLALMLAFTFDLAASRFDARKSLVLEESNAIGTTYLRAGLLPETQRAEVRKLLREYVKLRLAAVQSGELEQGIARSEELQQQIWAQAETVGEKNPGSILIGLFIESLNNMIDLHASRVTRARDRLPASIWVVLGFLIVFANGTIGYQAGLTGARKLLAVIPLALTASAVLWLIADLDRSREGYVKVSQQALVDLLRTMDKGRP